jgi:hypothetical protein
MDMADAHLLEVAANKETEINHLTSQKRKHENETYFISSVIGL